MHRYLQTLAYIPDLMHCNNRNKWRGDLLPLLKWARGMGQLMRWRCVFHSDIKIASTSLLFLLPVKAIAEAGAAGRMARVGNKPAIPLRESWCNREARVQNEQVY